MSWSGTLCLLIAAAVVFKVMAWLRRRLGHFRGLVVTRPRALPMAANGAAMRRDWEAVNALDRARAAAADPAALRHLPDPPCEVEG